MDANSGKVINRYSMIDNALDREIREAVRAERRHGLRDGREEGDPFPGDLNQDQQNIYVVSSGESYWFFKNAFNRDSYDGNGAKRITSSTTTPASPARTPTGTA